MSEHALTARSLSSSRGKPGSPGACGFSAPSGLDSSRRPIAWRICS
jgi:hypothetical protein